RICFANLSWHSKENFDERHSPSAFKTYVPGAAEVPAGGFSIRLRAGDGAHVRRSGTRGEKPVRREGRGARLGGDADGYFHNCTRGTLGDAAAGRCLRASHDAEKSWVHHPRGPYVGAWNRCEHGDL